MYSYNPPVIAVTCINLHITKTHISVFFNHFLFIFWCVCLDESVQIVIEPFSCGVYFIRNHSSHHSFPILLTVRRQSPLLALPQTLSLTYSRHDLISLSPVERT